jgi:hypothetical protein
LRSRFLTPGEKRDVVAAALDLLRPQNPGCHVHITVEDWTDGRGVPKWTATILAQEEGEAGTRVAPR